MGKIYLIRHAEAEGNLYRRVHGWYDSPLTLRGLDQVKALEKRFPPEKYIYLCGHGAIWNRTASPLEIEEMA